MKTRITQVFAAIFRCRRFLATGLQLQQLPVRFCFWRNSRRCGHRYRRRELWWQYHEFDRLRRCSD